MHRERQCISRAGTVRPINIYLVSTFFYAHLGVPPLPFNGGAFVTVPRCFVHSYMTRKYTVYVLRSGGASTPLNNKPCLFSPASAASPPPPPPPQFLVFFAGTAILCYPSYTLRTKEVREFLPSVPRLRKKRSSEASRAPPSYCELTEHR